MNPACRTALTVVAVFAALLAGAPSHAGAVKAYVDGPIVVGDQLFAGGTLEVQAIGRGDLLAIRIDGRQIALAFGDARASMLANGRGSLVLHRDVRGVHHLAGLQSGDAASFAALRVAAVSRGVTTVPPSAPDRGEGVARVPR